MEPVVHVVLACVTYHPYNQIQGSQSDRFIFIVQTLNDNVPVVRKTQLEYHYLIG